MDYDLAKKLKDAGFPQKMEKYILRAKSGIYATKDGSIIKYRPEITMEMQDEAEIYAIPTLSELIEACGEHFEWLENENALNPDNRKPTWSAQGVHKPIPTRGTILITGCSSPEIAVANLWLALNNKIK